MTGTIIQRFGEMPKCEKVYMGVFNYEGSRVSCFSIMMPEDYLDSPLEKDLAINYMIVNNLIPWDADKVTYSIARIERPE